MVLSRSLIPGEMARDGGGAITGLERSIRRLSRLEMVVAWVQTMAVEMKRSRCSQDLFWWKKRKVWEWGVGRGKSKS